MGAGGNSINTLVGTNGTSLALHPRPHPLWLVLALTPRPHPLWLVLALPNCTHCFIRQQSLTMVRRDFASSIFRTLLCTIDCIPLLPKNAIGHTKDTGDKHVVGIAL